MATRTGMTLTDRFLRAGISGAMRVKRRLTRSERFAATIYAERNRAEFRQIENHDLMLADVARNRAYARAIAANVNEGDVVVDLGTGTGVLACVAARRRARRVYAIDHNDVDAARALAAANGLSNIEFHQVHSEEFDPGVEVDVILHEQIGDSIFEEHMISNVSSLRDRVLRRGGRILPNRFELYLEPAEMPPERTVPLIWEHQVEGVDFSALRSIADREPRYPGPLAVWPGDFKRLLCDPDPALSIDLEHDRPDTLPAGIRSSREVTTAGIQHGIAVYFVARFDDVNGLTNAPLVAQVDARVGSGARIERARHWRLFMLRTEARERRRGERLELELGANRLEEADTWRWRLDDYGEPCAKLSSP